MQPCNSCRVIGHRDNLSESVPEERGNLGLKGICCEKTLACLSGSSACIDLLQAILNQHMKSTGRSYLLIISHLVNQNIAPQLRKDLVSSQEPYMEGKMEMLYQEEGKSFI